MCFLLGEKCSPYFTIQLNREGGGLGLSYEAGCNEGVRLTQVAITAIAQ